AGHVGADERLSRVLGSVFRRRRRSCAMKPKHACGLVVTLLLATAAWPAAAAPGLLDVPACLYGNGDAVAAACDRIIDSGLLKGNLLAQAYAARGTSVERAGDYDRAIADLDQAIRLEPRYPEAFNNRGMALLLKDRLDRALADFDQAIRLKPDYSTAFTNRGLGYLNRAQYDHAIADFDAAIRLDPNDARAFSNRGGAYVNKSEYDRALADLDQSIKLNPRSVDAFTYRGTV